MSTVDERLERVERLLTEPVGGWHHIPLLEQARAAYDEVRGLRHALMRAKEAKAAGDG